MPVRLVDDPAAFLQLMSEVSHAELIALDTEAASFHRYHNRIYLIQLSTRETTAVIDPLAVGSLEPIGQLLANPQVEKVFHDADYDLRLFDREFGFRARHLFDTRVAAQLLNEPGIGLGALLEKYFGVTADKRFQRADWSARPLTAAMLEYAAGDTLHLCALRDILRARLEEVGRLSWAEEEFEITESTRWTGSEADPETDFMTMKGARTLDGRGLARLRELYNWRAALADLWDRSEFRIVTNEVLLHLAANPVRSREELQHIRGLGRSLLESHGDEIIEAIGRGDAVPDNMLPAFARSPRRVADPAYEARLNALKLLRNQLAERYDLAPGVLCPNGTLEHIGRAEPESLSALAALGPVRRWQVREFGEALLAVLHVTESDVAKER